MNQIQYAGSWHSTMAQAAAAWADTALPDVHVIGSDEDPEEAARSLEEYWWKEAQRVGEGAPEDVNEDEWREACRDALVTLINNARADQRNAA